MNIQHFIEPAVVLCATVVLHLMWNKAFNTVFNQFFDRLQPIQESLARATRKPIVYCIWFAATLIIIQQESDVLGFTLSEKIPSWPFMLLLITLLAIANRWALKFQEYYQEGDRSTNISAISKLISAVLITILGLSMLDAFGVDYGSVLAIGGIGGIAIGFAAKDILSNVLSGVALHIEKHINIGDFIRTTSGITGTIKHIGWRATTIVTPDQTPLYVPNDVINSEPLENISRNFSRHVKMRWFFELNDTDAVKNFCQEADGFLSSLEIINQLKPTFCLINDIHPKGLEVYIHFNLRTQDWESSLQQRHSIIYTLISIAEGKGAKFATPKLMFNEHSGDYLTTKEFVEG